MAPPLTDPVERFWSKVERSTVEACWLWKAGLFSDGYGVFRLAGRNLRAHRFAYEIAKGAIGPGLVVMHACDEPRCCNPAHLSLGLPRDNTADMVRKRRQATGDRNGSRLHPAGRRRGQPRVKITTAAAAEIRNALTAGARKSALARAFGVHPTTISRVARHG